MSVQLKVIEKGKLRGALAIHVTDVGESASTPPTSLLKLEAIEAIQRTYKLKAKLVVVDDSILKPEYESLLLSLRDLNYTIVIFSHNCTTERPLFLELASYIVLTINMYSWHMAKCNELFYRAPDDLKEAMLSEVHKQTILWVKTKTMEDYLKFYKASTYNWLRWEGV